MTVEICHDPVSWDGFVAGMPRASNYHRYLWQHPIRETYGHEPYYLVARQDGAIQGVLPLVFIKSSLFGKFLVSVPFFSYGGVLARCADASEKLLGKASEVAAGLGADYVELRQVDELAGSWHGVSAKVTMVVRLPARWDDLWARLSSGMRNKIRYAHKQGLRPEWGGKECISHFYPLFAVNMRNLGTPVYPREWFENLCKHEAEIKILTIWDGERPVAAAFLVPFRDTLELPWSASLPDSHKKYSHVFLYATFLEWAVGQGFRQVDLGRSTPHGGTYEFKRHWKCEELPLHRYYWLAPGRPLPQTNPDNGKYRLAAEVWKHLPLVVANALGPRIVRSIP